MISVVQLGRIAYAEGLRLQQKLVELRKAGRIGDLLLLVEHLPVITLGRNAKAVNVLLSTEQLAARGVEIFECDRGGDVTFHGPGQIVGYPIVDLRGFERSSQFSVLSSQEGGSRLSASSSRENQEEGSTRKTLGAVDYVRRLEEVLIRTCADFGIAAKRVAGMTGVWTEPDYGAADASQKEIADYRPIEARPVEGRKSKLTESGSKEKKIAAIGVHISRSVTSHGFALNVNTDLSYFDLIVPCGIASKPVTSMQKELEREVDLEAVAQSVARNFGTVFGRETRWVESVEAVLGETVGVPMKVPEELRKMRGEDEAFLA